MKLIIMIVVPVVLLAGGGAGAYFMGVFGGEEVAEEAGETGEAVAEEVPPEEMMPPVMPENVVFVDLPDLLLNLNVTGKRLRFLKVVTSLEVSSEEMAEIVRQMTPRILDNLHLYFRSVSPEELAGPDGVYRIKEDLLVRVNDTIQPAVVRDVLVKEMLVQ
ncbi:MAG: flagellar basal body-associated FliL family protein [Alphaproteobacteria bacterium]|nr:flagellar basal body-associated FliL family protein [Alphaproteobacteria bacterium]